MPPLSEISLTRSVLELREACPETGEFATRLHDELHLSTEESEALATALADRFLSQSEQGDLLGRLELRGVLASGSSPGGFLARLSGSDGREALRHHARHLADGLAPDPRSGARSPMAAEAFRELAALLPHGIGSSGLGLPLSGGVGFGIYHYLGSEDPFLSALAEELRGNWESARDPVLRMRSARVLAETGDRAAADFLRESEAACAGRYTGDLSLDERIARACGLAVDGHPAAIRFLQNLAMDPRAATERRARALNYLPPDSLENGSDAGEVFRSLAEDPDEPVATRYLLLRLLARAPHPPEADWWRGLLRDPSITVEDHPMGSGADSAEDPVADFSQWNLVLAALGESRAPWSADLLLEAMDNPSLPASQRREAMMAYILHEGHGTVPWERFRGVLASQSGWGILLSRVEGRETELRLRFPFRIATDPNADFDVRALSCVGKEIVLRLREGTAGGWLVDFRPIDPAHDALSARPVLPESENAFPVNRRIFLDGLNLEAPEDEPEIAARGAGEGAPSVAVMDSAEDRPVRLASNEQQDRTPDFPNTVQQDRRAAAPGSPSNAHAAEERRGI
ncbi:MAG: hypothetical protein U1F66_10725 [bacterium]